MDDEDIDPADEEAVWRRFAQLVRERRPRDALPLLERMLASPTPSERARRTAREIIRKYAGETERKK